MATARFNFRAKRGPSKNTKSTGNEIIVSQIQSRFNTQQLLQLKSLISCYNNFATGSKSNNMIQSLPIPVPSKQNNRGRPRKNVTQN